MPPEVSSAHGVVPPIGVIRSSVTVTSVRLDPPTLVAVIVYVSVSPTEMSPLPSASVDSVGAGFTTTSAAIGTGVVTESVTGSVWSESAVAVLTMLPAAASAATTTYVPINVHVAPGTSRAHGASPPVGVIRGSATDTLVRLAPPDVLGRDGVGQRVTDRDVTGAVLVGVGRRRLDDGERRARHGVTWTSVTGGVWSESAVAVLTIEPATRSAGGDDVGAHEGAGATGQHRRARRCAAASP